MRVSIMMRLQEQDRERILEYVGHEPEVNIFFIGDVENFGVDCDEVSIFATEKDGTWDSLVLRYINDYVVYSQNSAYDASAVADFLKNQNVGMISGKSELITQLTGFFPERLLRPTIMTRCSSVRNDFSVPEDIEIRPLTVDDAEILTDLMMLIDEFKKSYTDRESSVKKLRTSLLCGSTACGAFKNGMLVSCAQAGASNSKSAMVVGVATHPSARSKGYASAVVSLLCREALQSGKEFLCLFYDNPIAGRIYNRIGFEPFGEYALFN